MAARWFAIGAWLGALGVALGAFGAHGLKARVSAEMVAVWETGARYHVLHALALLATGWAVDRWPSVSRPTLPGPRSSLSTSLRSTSATVRRQ